MEPNVEQEFQHQLLLLQQQETVLQYLDGMRQHLVVLHFSLVQQIIIIPLYQIQQRFMFRNLMELAKVFDQLLQLLS